jgi:preprotein translocase subunit SecF
MNNKTKFNFDFVQHFNVALIISSVFIIASVSLIFSDKLSYGVDFSGGAEIQLQFKTLPKLETLRSDFKKNKYSGVSIQRIGNAQENEILVKIAASKENLNQVTEDISKFLFKDYSSYGPVVRKTEIVGAKAGEQLRNTGAQAMLWALLAIMIYIGLRFEFKYSPGAICALLHDVTIILGAFALTGKEINLQIVAALLAVIGYSVNDTVIIYDRVRENEEKYIGKSLREHINLSINETLMRTILTSGTTLFMSFSMMMWGGLVIQDFFFAITLGVIIGTYSSTFVAAPVTMFFERFNEKETVS